MRKTVKKVTCPVCKMRVKYKTKKTKYKCPNCTAIFYSNQTIAKPSLAKILYVISVMFALSGCAVGVFSVAKWMMGSGGYNGVKARPELLVVGYGIILLTVIFSVSLYSFGKTVEKDNIKRYHMIARTKRKIRAEEALAKKRVEEEKEKTRAIRESKKYSNIFGFVKEKFRDVIRVLKDEEPRSVALILSDIDDSMDTKRIMSELSSEKQRDVIIVASSLNSVSVKDLVELDEMLRKKLSLEKERIDIELSGIRLASDLLNASSKEVQYEVLEQLAMEKPDFAEQLERRLLRFGRLRLLSNEDLSKLLEYVHANTIAYAIEYVDKDLKKRIFRNSSQTKRYIINRAIRNMPNEVSNADVEKAQVDIMEIAQKMADDGKIIFVYDESET